MKKLATATANSDLCAIATALQERSLRKEAMKKAELRFAVIYASPDGVAKTNYPLQLLNETDMKPSQPQVGSTLRIAIHSLLDDK